MEPEVQEKWQDVQKSPACNNKRICQIAALGKSSKDCFWLLSSQSFKLLVKWQSSAIPLRSYLGYKRGTKLPRCKGGYCSLTLHTSDKPRNQIGRYPQQTIKLAIDCDTGELVSAESLLSLEEVEFTALRRSATDAYFYSRFLYYRLQ